MFYLCWYAYNQITYKTQFIETHPSCVFIMHSFYPQTLKMLRNIDG